MKENLQKFKLDPRKPPKSDWRAFDAMSEQERHCAAVADQDALPTSEEKLAHARRLSER